MLLRGGWNFSVLLVRITDTPSSCSLSSLLQRQSYIRPTSLISLWPRRPVSPESLWVFKFLHLAHLSPESWKNSPSHCQVASLKSLSLTCPCPLASVPTTPPKVLEGQQFVEFNTQGRISRLYLTGHLSSTGGLCYILELLALPRVSGFF